MKQVSPFMLAIDDICEEKGLDKAIILETVEAALAAAYRKDYGKARQIIRTKLNPETGQAEMFRIYDVIEDPEEIKEHEHELTLDEAKEIDAKAEYGKEVIVPLPHHDDFGRIAAQTAKQVIIQRIREAERDLLFAEFKDKENKIITATVSQLEGRNIVVSLGKVNGILYPSEQIPNERYHLGQRLKVVVKEVSQSVKGPQIIVSRSNEELIRGLFEIEVPEILAGTVEIKSIAREAGFRTKIAVIATEDKVDPVGSCVGQRGTRVQAVLDEIGMEKIDIVLWDEDVEQFIMNALSPAKTRQIQISSKDSKATVYVDTDNLSLAIGKNGQNVRLASKLTGWGIDIKSLEDLGEEAAAEAVEKKEMTISTAKKAPAKKKVSKKSKAKKDKIIDEE
ncbi:transcription termination/antitermination protein NusA [Candidatus Berkelbacteria bacterium CG10_big_fil_rev_8_21_14_0_10_43_13]|uniref:Transcription termination/antitermination protein NusA n=1 Tax=Candidatus Berkelbacteria bacterium CG10_big_fil_rev_8_21_14_0_10_43_13 TaxID=1974514 RepID=A0A2H0W6B2_9BACT|nr:MAG: transcription termination/antitermination protein NusA [Candidatus Berkelbacteria bacterium CG10_big_fil_rev_8_21_14_0_10_43_13]